MLQKKGQRQNFTTAYDCLFQIATGYGDNKGEIFLERYSGKMLSEELVLSACVFIYLRQGCSTSRLNDSGCGARCQGF